MRYVYHLLWKSCLLICVWTFIKIPFIFFIFLARGIFPFENLIQKIYHLGGIFPFENLIQKIYHLGGIWLNMQQILWLLRSPYFLKFENLHQPIKCRSYEREVQKLTNYQTSFIYYRWKKIFLFFRQKFGIVSSLEKKKKRIKNKKVIFIVLYQYVCWVFLFITNC